MFNNQALLEHTDRLRNFALRLTNNYAEAEDLTQSTLLRALEKKHLFKEDTNLYSWISKIMFNMFVSNYRRKTKFESQYDPEPILDRESVLPAQEKELYLKDVDNAMNRISEDHREILVLVCVKGMAYADVADHLKIPVGTVRSRLSRARESLENALSHSAMYKSHDIPPIRACHGSKAAA